MVDYNETDSRVPTTQDKKQSGCGTWEVSCVALCDVIPLPPAGRLCPKS